MIYNQSNENLAKEDFLILHSIFQDVTGRFSGGYDFIVNGDGLVLALVSNSLNSGKTASLWEIVVRGTRYLEIFLRGDNFSTSKRIPTSYLRDHKILEDYARVFKHDITFYDLLKK